MKRITSRQNPVVAAFRDASRGVTQGLLLLDGPHLVHEALGARLAFREVLVSADERSRPELADLVARLEAAGAPVTEASATVLEAASPVRSGSPIVALAERPHARVPVYRGDRSLVVIACDVQDPGNIGAIIRVAEAAGASGVVVAGHGADPFSWKALRGSMGSALRLPIALMPDVRAAVDEARRAGAQVVATVPRSGVTLFDADLARPTALLIGGEGPGLPADVLARADVRLSIPMESPVESLNAAVAAAVLLYEARRQRTAAPGHASAQISVPAARG